jgi:hypothetical protein
LLNRITSFNWGGDKESVLETKAKLGTKAVGPEAMEYNEGYGLREFQSHKSPYRHVFAAEKYSLRLKNSHSWQISS